MATNTARAPGSGLSGLINDDNYMWWAALPVIMGMFIVIMDSSIVNVALPHMMAAFGSNVEEIEWVSTGYMLSSAVMMPTTGFLGDRFGRKTLYAVAIALFTIVSMLCGMAWDTNSLVLFRVLQGITGGAIQPVGQAILFEAFPPHKRGMSMALVGMGAMLAPMLGPTIGGYLVEYLNWRWIFYVNLVPGIIATFLALAILRENPRRVVPFDSAGFFMMAVFLTTILLGVSQGNSKGWDSPYIIGMFAVAAISFAVYVIIELWVKHPVTELRLFQYSTYTAGTFASIIMGVGLFGGVFLQPLFLQTLMGYDAIQTGLLMIPQGLTMGVMMPIAGMLNQRVDPRILMTLGLGTMGGTLIWQGQMSPDTPVSMIIGWTILRSVGMALAFPAMNQTTLGAVPLRNIGAASGLFNVTRSLGGTFGIALLSTFLTQRQIAHTAQVGEAAARAGQAPHLMAGIAQHFVTMGASPQLAQMQAGMVFGMAATKQAMVYAFQDAFIAAGIVVALGFVPSLFVKKNPAHAAPAGAAHVALE